MLSAAFLVAGCATMPTVAYADEGDRGDVYWNPANEEIAGIITTGNTICDGTRWQNVCYTYFRASGEVVMHYTSRQRHGVGTNFGTVRLVRADENGYVIRDEAGNVMTTLSKTAVVENGNARMYSVFSAAFNGFAGSVAGPAVCAIAGSCGGNGGGGSVAYAVSGSVADALAATETNTTVNWTNGPAAGCAPGACTPQGD